MQHDGRDNNLALRRLCDFIRNDRHAFPNTSNHVAPHAETNDGVLLVRRGCRDVRGDLDAAGNIHQPGQGEVVRVIVTIGPAHVRIGIRPDDDPQVVRRRRVLAIDPRISKLRDVLREGRLGCLCMIREIRPVKQPLVTGQDLLIELVRQRFRQVHPERRVHARESRPILAAVEKGRLDPRRR